MSGDAVVIGAGHNGMVAALRLAAAGRRVTVVERREVVGGLAAGEEFHPGYRSPGLLHDTAGLRPRIAARVRAWVFGGISRAITSTRLTPSKALPAGIGTFSRSRSVGARSTDSLK